MRLHSFGVTLLLASRFLNAQAPNPLSDRLRSAELATTLTREGVDPFYLKIDVQLFDAKGKPSDNGTIEEWWAGHATEKTVYTTPSYTATQVRKGDEIFRSSGATYPPSVLKLLLDQVIDPMPSENEITNSTQVLNKIKLRGVPLECIVLKMRNDADGPPPDFCFDPGKDSLRITSQYGSLVTIRNGVGTFQQKRVPMDVVVRVGDLMAATGHIAALISRPVPDSEVSAVGLTENIFLVPPLAMKGSLIQHPDPIYPEQAKRQLISGVVVLQAVIGSDGHIHDLTVVSSPSVFLTNAARDAVSRWVYKPYEVRGSPQKVETTVSVWFRIS